MERKNCLIQIFHFFRGSNENSGKVKVTMGKGWALVMGKEKPYKVHFTEDTKYIDKLKDILATLLQKYFLPFFDHKRTKVQIKWHILSWEPKESFKLANARIIEDQNKQYKI